MTRSSSATPHAGYAAARQVCRRAWPDVHFAAHLLARADRHALFVTLAVVEQLRRIVWSDDHDACGVDATPDVSACDTCTGDTCEQRAKVCAAVLDALLAGETTGRADLDAFAAVAHLRQLPRARFDEIARGWLVERSLRRVATWSRFRELSRAGWAGAGALLLHAASGRSPDELPSHAREQVTALFTAAHWTGALHTRADGRRRGQLLLPLDDLVRCGLSERAVDDMLAEPSMLRNDERWRRFFAAATDRAVNLLRAGEAALPHLPPPGRKLLAAGHAQLVERWRQIERDPAVVLAPRTDASLGKRLRLLPTVWRSLAASQRARQ